MREEEGMEEGQNEDAMMLEINKRRRRMKEILWLKLRV